MAQKLRVRVNPGLHLDDKGRPCCAVPLDPELPSTIIGRYVGAIPNVAPHSGAVLTVAGVTSDPGVFEQNEITWTFDTATVFELENTAWYRQMLREQALLPADEFTARSAGVEFQTVAQTPTKKTAKE